MLAPILHTLFSDKQIRSLIDENYRLSFACWKAQCRDEFDKIFKEDYETAPCHIQQMQIRKYDRNHYQIDIECSVRYRQKEVIGYIVKITEDLDIIDDVFFTKGGFADGQWEGQGNTDV